MINRRQTLSILAGALPALTASRAAGNTAARLLLVHGRAQGGRSEAELREEWLGALREGARLSGHEIAEDLDVLLPFYGNSLDEMVSRFEVPLNSEIRTKGDTFQDEFLEFQAEVADEMRRGAGITDEQVDDIYGDNPREKGPQNWEWVQAIIAALDNLSPNSTDAFLERFLRDVFLYLQSPLVRAEIDRIVTSGLDSRPTVIVGHSLGTVVAYHVLLSRPDLNVPLFLTVGSPLGIRAIRRRFVPLTYPSQAGKWLNAFDNRDIVALNPLDEVNFPVTPAIENIRNINNQTGNRHGISGYLDKPRIVGPIIGAL